LLEGLSTTLDEAAQALTAKFNYVKSVVTAIEQVENGDLTICDADGLPVSQSEQVIDEVVRQ